ncbi:MAG: hypothetical protein O2856_08635 [Planctomycetota bacterium]|nr:hypothetical protein [Planctomycetota bacterium]
MITVYARDDARPNHSGGRDLGRFIEFRSDTPIRPNGVIDLNEAA